ncbi:hypothetical protein ACVIW0_007500 [Bradyrhizobium sp. USDA 4454]
MESIARRFGDASPSSPARTSSDTRLRLLREIDCHLVELMLPMKDVSRSCEQPDTPSGSASALPLAATNGIWTKSLSRSRANNIGSGALSTRMASSRRLDPALKRLARRGAAHEEALEIRRYAAA